VEVAVRVSDADRERVADRLRRAQAEGRIDLLEYDERLASAYAARTEADLEPLTADLPPEVAEPARPEPTRARCRAGRGYALALRIEVAAWLFAGLLNLGIWAIVSVAGWHLVYPWWIWVVGPWGLVLLARLVEHRLRTGSSTRF
jgi:hypothetical protein